MNVRGFLTELSSNLGLTTDEELSVWLGSSKDAMDKWIQRDKLPKKWELIIEKKKNSPNMSGQNRKSETKKDDSVSLSVSLLSAGAGEGIYNFEEEKTLLSLNPILFPYLIDKKITAVQIMGDSMEPTLRQGDFILITEVNKERQTEDGIYAIRIDGMIKVKSLQFLLDGTIKIISYNKNYETEVYNPTETQVDFSILGKHTLTLSR